MDDVNNVIHLKDHIAAKKNKAKTKAEPMTPESVVVDMAERRNQMLKAERRQSKRTILADFVGAFAVIPKKGLVKVVIHDISDQGVAFDLETEHGRFRIGEEVALRIYLNQNTYFPFVALISHCRENQEEGTHRHGAGFVKNSVNDVALHHFIKFIEAVSGNLKKDNGDLVVSKSGIF